MIRKLAKKIRHSRLLHSQEWLWNQLRKAYFFCIDPFGRGVKVRIGGAVDVRMPGDMTGSVDWENYEPEVMQKLRDWIQKEDDPVILDVGSAIGVFSLAALGAHPRARVIAFESNLQSIAVSRYLTRHYDQSRLQILQGLICSEVTDKTSFQDGLESTQQKLKSQKDRNPRSSSKYICLDDPESRQIPKYSLDVLHDSMGLKGKRILFKVDVEGAELMVLEGAKKFIQACQPDLLLSAHPPALPRYGHSMEKLEKAIENLGYNKVVISEDHEIHLFCQPEKR